MITGSCKFHFSMRNMHYCNFRMLHKERHVLRSRRVTWPDIIYIYMYIVYMILPHRMDICNLRAANCNKALWVHSPIHLLLHTHTECLTLPPFPSNPLLPHAYRFLLVKNYLTFLHLVSVWSTLSRFISNCIFLLYRSTALCQ